MRRIAFSLIAVATMAGIVAATAPSPGDADEDAAAISAGKLPPGYRDWKMIAVDNLLVPGKTDQLRAQLGNEIAI